MNALKKIIFCLTAVTTIWVHPSAAMIDGGVEAVVDAQEDTRELSAEDLNVSGPLKDWIRAKGWTEGWDKRKKRLIFAQEVGGRIRPTEPDFMEKRTALYQELELRLKAAIIQAISLQVDASVYLDIPGNPIKRQLEALEAKAKDQQQAAEDAVYYAKQDYAEILSASEIAKLDELEGVTNADRYSSILDGIAKRLDDTYDPEQITEGKRVRVEELKSELAVAAEGVKRAEALRDEVASQGAEKLAALRNGNVEQTLTSNAEILSEMPLMGAVVLKTMESYDGRRDYRIGGVMAWSPQLESEASELLLGRGKGKPRPGKKSFDEWIQSKNLSNMIGTRRYLEADGTINFVGFSAVEYDPDNIRRHARQMSKAQTRARAMAALSMRADTSYRSVEQTQTKDVSTSEGTETITFEDFAESIMQSTNGPLQIDGLISPSPVQTVHEPSGKPIFVAYAHINSDLASNSSEFKRRANQLAILINRDQAERRGRDEGMRAAVEASKDDKRAYQAGYDEGKESVLADNKGEGNTTGSGRPALAGDLQKACIPGAVTTKPVRPSEKGKVQQGCAKAGLFDDDSDDADDDF